MSAPQEDRAEWLDSKFWDRLDRLECQHRVVQLERESARRRLDRAGPGGSDEVRDVWQRYCDVIAELDRTTAEFDVLYRSAS